MVQDLFDRRVEEKSGRRIKKYTSMPEYLNVEIVIKALWPEAEKRNQKELQSHMFAQPFISMAPNSAAGIESWKKILMK